MNIGKFIRKDGYPKIKLMERFKELLSNKSGEEDITKALRRKKLDKDLKGEEEMEEQLGEEENIKE
jgi:hypothetical protein